MVQRDAPAATAAAKEVAGIIREIEKSSPGVRPSHRNSCSYSHSSR
jgi:hypothetical protein